MDDAAQELWLVVHRRHPSFEGRSEFRTWLFGIALNVARNHRRAEARSPSGQPLSQGLADPAPDPHGVREGDEAWELVQQFLSELSDEDRAIFVCNLLECLSASETATAIRVDVSRVYHRVRAWTRRDANTSQFDSNAVLPCFPKLEQQRTVSSSRPLRRS